MTGKEALERLSNVEVSVTSIRSGMTYFKTLKEKYEKEFEVLEKELFVRDIIKPFDVYEEQYKQLEKKYQKLEKALDKACERLEYYTGTCPFEQKLMFETNCDLNCKDTYKECWKKYFMKEVSKND